MRIISIDGKKEWPLVLHCSGGCPAEFEISIPTDMSIVRSTITSSKTIYAACPLCGVKHPVAKHLVPDEIYAKIPTETYVMAL